MQENTQENNLKSALEALVFVSEKPVTINQITKALGTTDASGVRQAMEELKTDYENQNRGLRIVEVAGGFQMVAAGAFAPFLKKLFRERAPEKLSKPALETLAIIAYKQPLTRAEIESLRNVNVDGVMKNLTDKNLVRICGRRKVPGRPFVYGTTREFLEHFGLRGLEDLPKMEDFTAMLEEKETEKQTSEEIPPKAEVKDALSQTAPED